GQVANLPYNLLSCFFLFVVLLNVLSPGTKKTWHPARSHSLLACFLPSLGLMSSLLTFSLVSLSLFLAMMAEILPDSAVSDNRLYPFSLSLCLSVSGIVWSPSD